jgi:hypothetical protein
MSWKHLVRARPSIAVEVPLYLSDLISDHRCTPPEARGLIYRALVRAANRAAACPTGDMLAVICGYDSAHGTVVPIKRLEQRGLIRVERFTRSRRVTVVATGKRTRACTDNRPHWRLAREKPGREATAESAEA